MMGLGSRWVQLKLIQQKINKLIPIHMTHRSLSFRTLELYQSHKDIQHTCGQTSQPRQTKGKT
jgi:hypothetical protein